MVKLLTNAPVTVTILVGSSSSTMAAARRLSSLRRLAPEIMELKNAVKQENLPSAMEALARCSGSRPPPRPLYNQLLALSLHQPAQRQLVKAHMASAGISPDESTLTLEVRALTQAGDIQQAIDALTAACISGDLTPKLRTFAPVLHALFERRDLRRASALLDHMADAGVEMGEEERVGFVVATAQADAADGKSAHLALVAQLRSLQLAHGTLTAGSISRLQTALDAPARRERGGYARLATIDSDGVCSVSGARLNALPLETADRNAFCSALLGAAAALGPELGDDLRAFGDWVSARRFKFILDGANVGYRHQNFVGGTFSFGQVEVARAALRAKAAGDEPLIVMPRRYLNDMRVPNHTNMRSADRHTLPERWTAVTAADEELIRGWRSSGAMWSTPDGAQDDWYWMYATVLIGAHARVLTTDKMRDHVFHIALGNWFERWRARHVMRFAFSHPGMDGRPPPGLRLDEPPAYSAEVQCDEDRMIWHLPVGPDDQDAAKEVGGADNPSWAKLGEEEALLAQSHPASRHDEADLHSKNCTSSQRPYSAPREQKQWLCVAIGHAV